MKPHRPVSVYEHNGASTFITSLSSHATISVEHDPDDLLGRERVVLIFTDGDIAHRFRVDFGEFWERLASAGALGAELCTSPGISGRAA